ncbi:major paralogous domain-containing protein [Fibrobacter sp. UWCM]|uniref:FISUMP domain-containing protein n=1 Tax=Fibrobacter sp. UWCM TaxID=1896208 RepID=UPI000915873F|nr:FISUMP domain-containing protein [Fibrobacter sp. UWCM]SHG97422.1 major paralogous domain-containing protein [Fibrobacter sp. UWCM]
MYRKLFCGIAVAIVMLFSACGDDSSTGSEDSFDWKSLGDVVRGVCNLSPCDVALEGRSYYVFSEKRDYSCKSGIWVDSTGETFTDEQFIKCYKQYVSDDSALYFIESSSDMATDNSSDSESAADSVKVRGVCMTTAKNVERGDSVKYFFYNMGGIPQSFSWDFGSVADIESSTERTPTVTFLGNGNFRAGLVVNKGLPSESDSILCPVVHATGKLIAGCECTVDKSLTRVSSAEPDSAVWTVSGCEGGENLRYRWKKVLPSSYMPLDVELETVQEPELDSAWILSEDGMSVKLVLDSAQKVAPRLTVTNETDEYMDVECPAVRAVKKERVYAQCSMEFAGDTGYTFVVQSIGGADYLSELPMELSSDHGYSEKVKAQCFVMQKSSDMDEGKCVSWGRSIMYNAPASFAVPIPTEPGVHTYTLTFEGEEVCSARMPVTCSPNKERVFVNDTVKWAVNGLNGYEPSTYEWTFYKGYVEESVSTEATPQMKYTESGTYAAYLVMDRDLETEMSIRCKDAYVNRHSISSCTCGKPELLSESDDIMQTDAVSFRWKVTGCRSDIPLTYTWADGFTADETDSSQATATFTASGYYVPEVSVSNADGSQISLTCKLATVKGADTQELTYGGQTYGVVEINGRTWMAENLNYKTDYSMCFDDLEENCAKYGRLYTYEDAVRVCPNGWHLPGIDEFLEIYDMVDKLETYGFEPLPAGMYSYDFGQYISDEMSWWFDYQAAGADYGIVLVIDGGEFPYRDEYVGNAHSVRCVKD